MSFFSRQWTDPEKWAMGLASTIIIAIAGFVWTAMQGKVVAEIASGRDDFGRCVDKEIRISNNTSSDAVDLLVTFKVDHFTRNGDIAIDYGDERDQFVPPGGRTLIPRSTYAPVNIALDTKNSTVAVPLLQPNQQVHLFFGAELINDAEQFSTRQRLLWAKSPELMDVPRVSTITRKNGIVDVKRVRSCKPQ